MPPVVPPFKLFETLCNIMDNKELVSSFWKGHLCGSPEGIDSLIRHTARVVKKDSRAKCRAKPGKTFSTGLVL